MEAALVQILSSVGITALIFGLVLWFTVPAWVRGQIEGEIEKLKMSNQNLLNRFSKVHEKESIVLPKIYRKMIIAKSAVSQFRMGFSSYSDVSRMDEGEFCSGHEILS